MTFPRASWGLFTICSRPPLRGAPGVGKCISSPTNWCSRMGTFKLELQRGCDATRCDQVPFCPSLSANKATANPRGPTAGAGWGVCGYSGCCTFGMGREAPDAVTRSRCWLEMPPGILPSGENWECWFCFQGKSDHRSKQRCHRGRAPWEISSRHPAMSIGVRAGGGTASSHLHLRTYRVRPCSLVFCSLASLVGCSV